MLAAIASDPTALPLWVAFLFAVAMYPLGLLLPGCPCCVGGCTQCGLYATGYAAGQDGYGRMCCTGTFAASVTVRVTNVGSASSSVVTRTAGTSYIKRTYTFNCNSVVGDYVLPSMRSATATSATCFWGVNEDIYSPPPLYRLLPANNTGFAPDTGDFPNWKYWLRMFFTDSNRPSVRTQTCSGYPGVESCNIGTTASWYASLALWRSGTSDSGPDGIGPIAYGDTTYSAERCNPSGVTFSSSLKILASVSDPTGTSFGIMDTGCDVKVEFV